MSVVRTAGFDAFLRKPPKDLRAILVYGEDSIQVGDLARKAVKRFAGSVDDPFAVVRLDESSLSRDKALLSDEVFALSMLGGNRVVWVSGADAGFQRSMEAVFAATSPGNLVVAEAGVLAKSSGLRALFESSETAVIVPVYDASDEDLAGFIRREIESGGASVSPDAVSRLVDILRRDRGAAAQEVAKLLNYCAESRAVEVADVDAISSAGGEDALDDLIDSVFGGELEDADARLAGLLSGGIDSGRIAMSLHNHAVRLCEFRLKVHAGQQVEQVVRSARPMVFMQRVPRVVRQLNALGIESLVQLTQGLAQTVERCRLEPDLSEAILGRTVMTVSRAVRAERVSRS